MASRRNENRFRRHLYWVAIVLPDDPWRQPAERARQALGDARLVTTDEVLSEFLTALSSGGPQVRTRAVNTVRRILANADITVITQSHDSFLKALDRYSSRTDKQYSLTDCSSMNAMAAVGITEALTDDHHFEQEGFTVLIRP